jgi:hypothetical protein
MEGILFVLMFFQWFMILVALAVVVFLAKTLLGPLWRAGQFLAGHDPKNPGEIAQGITHGLRLLAWGAVVAGVWYFFIR